MRQRERSEGRKRRHPQITRRSRCLVEAPETKPPGQQDETSEDTQPTETQDQKKILSCLYSMKGPVPVKDWHKLDLGRPVVPPAHRQEVETGISEPVPSQVRDGILLKILIRICGRENIALIDCAALRCYIDSRAVLRMNLEPEQEQATLELGDGTKVPSSGCLPALRFTMGSYTYAQNFTVTRLMTGVDVVLGMTWLETVNPLIHWVTHTLYIRDRDTLYPITGVPADEEIQPGTVKHMNTNDQSTTTNSLEILETPQFWTATQND